MWSSKSCSSCLSLSLPYYHVNSQTAMKEWAWQLLRESYYTMWSRSVSVMTVNIILIYIHYIRIIITCINLNWPLPLKSNDSHNGYLSQCKCVNRFMPPSNMSNTGTHTLDPSDPTTPPLHCVSHYGCVQWGREKSRTVLENGVEGGGGRAAERERQQSKHGEEEKERQRGSGVSPDYNQPDRETGRTGVCQAEIKRYTLVWQSFSFCVSCRERKRVSHRLLSESVEKKGGGTEV